MQTPPAGSPRRLFGAGDLLTTLGWTPNLPNFFRFSGLIAALMLGFLGVTVAIGELLPIPPVLFQVLLWAGWLTWLGYFLPRHQARNLATDGNAYKHAFWRELCFGIGFNFAMLLRPMTVGIVQGGEVGAPPLIFALGLSMAGIGIFAILEGSRQLGVSCAFFVYEYAPGVEPPVIDRGVYGLLRHPLFTGGICMSIGWAICVGTPVALELAVVNLGVLVPYLPVEDHRCSRSVGPRYRSYRERVGGILPRPSRALPAGEPAQSQKRPT